MHVMPSSALQRQSGTRGDRGGACPGCVRPRRRFGLERAPRRGFTLAEAAASTLIIGLLLVAAVNAVGASKRTQRQISDSGRATLLAQDLLSEILRQAYEDPAAPGSLGLSAAEGATGNRSLFDDVDDYDGWTEQPPTDKSGAVLTGFDGWTRTVSVARVPLNDPATLAGADTGLKRITVNVSQNGVPRATLVSLRCAALKFDQEFR